MSLVDELVTDVAAQLCAIRHRRATAPYLVWPVVRQTGEQRISEQESKILVAQWLERRGCWYAVETPTGLTYQQSGKGSRSAMHDVTVFTDATATTRRLNIELKQGLPGVESFRKDFEKLVRESTEALWFHTLAAASARTWRVLEDRLCAAFDDVQEHSALAIHCMHFAFCVLENDVPVQFKVDFSTSWRLQIREMFAAARQRAGIPSTHVANGAGTQSTRERKTRVGVARKQLAYLPSVDASTFLVLNVKGESYRLRSFSATTVRAWQVPGCATLTELLARHAILHVVDVTADRRSLDRDRAHWAGRIAEANATFEIVTT